MKAEKSKSKPWVVILIGVVLGLIIVGTWTWYLATLPDTGEQLQNSPFYVSGEWKCVDENIDFVITSSENYEVKGVYTYLGHENTFEFHYLSNRGFNHKYAATIYFNNKEVRFSCVYDFREEEFYLKDIQTNSETELLKGIKELHFKKV